MQQSDVLIIGAGPAGAVAAYMLTQRGLSVIVLERSRFPRFSIGESLLPQCTELLETAGLLPAIEAAGFQLKNGAVVTTGANKSTVFDFADKISPGPHTTWHVERARFDHVLARAAMAAGADIHFGETITQAAIDAGRTVVETVDEDNTTHQYHSRFILDASGAGRVLARQMGLVQPCPAPPRTALFTHVEDRVSAPDYDRNKILLGIHPEHDDVWYWLIPFADRASLGVVGPVEKVVESEDERQALKDWVNAMPRMAELLADAKFDDKVRRMRGYSAAISRLHGPGFALLGNAGGFTDPVFSSGVTVAMKSAVLAVDLVIRELAGKPVDWDGEFEQPLRAGTSVFKGFVEAWYRGDLQKIFFSDKRTPTIYGYLCSILAGYVWDNQNPYTERTDQRLIALAQASV